MEQRKESLIIHRSQLESLLSLRSLADVKTILRAVLAYGLENTEPEVPEHLSFGWVAFKYMIDYDAGRYNKVIEKRRAAGRRSALLRQQQPAAEKPPESYQQVSTSVESVEQNHQVSTKPTYTDNDNDNEKENNSLFKKGEQNFSDEIEKILKIYPRVEYPDKARKEIALAVMRKSKQQKIPKEIALTAIAGKTELFAKLKNNLPEAEKRFIPEASRWFANGGFDADPAAWESADCGVDPRNPETWES